MAYASRLLAGIAPKPLGFRGGCKHRPTHNPTDLMNLKNSLSLLAVAAAMVLPVSAQDAPAIKPTGKAPSKAIAGYWAPNKEAMIKMMMDQMPAEAKGDPATLAAMKPMLEEMAAKLAFRFAEGESEIVTPQGTETAKWKVVSEDAKTGNLKVAITKPDGSSEDGEAIVGKDKMILINTKEKMQITCDRITKEEFDKRKGAGSPGE